MLSKQAENIVRKFGGVTKLSKAIGVGQSTVYKWLYPAEGKTRGTDGVIPRKHISKIREAAEVLGIELTEEDWRL